MAGVPVADFVILSDWCLFVKTKKPWQLMFSQATRGESPDL